MAVDIGPKIGIDGEAEFRKQINNITQQVKTYASEMQVLSTAFDDNTDAEETMTRKSAVLSQEIEAQQKKIELLQRGLSEAAQKFGETDDKTLRWQQAVNRATADLNKMQAELKQNESAMNRLENETDDVSEALDDAGNSAVGFGDILSANLAADAITGGISNIISGLRQVSEESREYRKIMGSLEISSEKAGYSADETADAYNKLYGVLGDSQTAATTTANLQALGLEQGQLNELINGTIGAWTTYGDSIPIDGLAESINETVKAGTVTGTFADVLNWAGTSEDEFNEKMAACSTESERANLILQELSNQGLIAAGEGWQQNNASLIAANQATADHEAAMAELGETVEPIFTKIQEKITQVVLKLNEFAQWAMENGPVITAVVAGIGAGFVAWNVVSIIQSVTTAISAFKLANEGATIAQYALNAAMNANPIGLLITAITAIVTAIGMFIATNEDARNKISEVWETIKSTVSSAIDTVKQILDSIIQFIQNNWQALLLMLVNPFAGAFKLLYDNCEQFRQTVDKMVENVKNAFQNLYQNVTTKAREIGTTIINGIKSAVDYIASLPGQFLNWGRDMIDNLISGIKEGIGKIGDAIGSVADTIRSYIHFSKPDKGPLADFDTYMPDMTKMITSGIRSGIPEIEKAMKEEAAAMRPNLQEANGTAIAYNRLAEKLGNLQVVLNDGTLVGKLTPRINSTLGGYARKEGRFGV